MRRRTRRYYIPSDTNRLCLLCLNLQKALCPLHGVSPGVILPQRLVRCAGWALPCVTAYLAVSSTLVYHGYHGRHTLFPPVPPLTVLCRGGLHELGDKSEQWLLSMMETLVIHVFYKSIRSASCNPSEIYLSDL